MLSQSMSLRRKLKALALECFETCHLVHYGRLECLGSVECRGGASLDEVAKWRAGWLTEWLICVSGRAKRRWTCEVLI